MKPKIHPPYKEVKITCSCGNSFVTRSTLGKPTLTLEVCSNCHPFYTGTQKLLDSGGRVDRFRQKYSKKIQQPKPVAAKPEEKPKAKAKPKKPRKKSEK